MRKLIASTLLTLDGVIGEPRAWASDPQNAGDQHGERLAREARTSR
jgi:hypothetical protein